jgi:hypothetical protein
VLSGLSHNRTLIICIIINKIQFELSSYLLPLWIFHYSSPCYHSFAYFFISSISILQMDNTRNHKNAENNNATNPPPPPHQLLSKCYQCKLCCFRPCSRPWSTCRMLSTKHCHHNQGIDLETFSAPSHLLSLTLSSRWTLTIGSSLWRRNCKWCSTTIMRR